MMLETRQISVAYNPKKSSYALICSATALFRIIQIVMFGSYAIHFNFIKGFSSEKERDQTTSVRSRVTHSYEGVRQPDRPGDAA